MDPIRPSASKRPAGTGPAEDTEPQDTQKSSPQKLRCTETTDALNQKASTQETKETVEIPSLDEMASYLLANEVIEKDNFPILMPTQPKQKVGVPSLIATRNLSDGMQSLSARLSDRNSQSLLNHFELEENKREIDILFKMAQSLASNGDYQQAIEFYNKIISLNEKSASAWIAKGHCYAALGQDFKALTTYQEALKTVPSSQKDEQLWYGIGLIYQKFGEWNSSEISFRNALRLEPNINLKAEILYNIGMVLKAKGEYSEAVKMLTNAILTEVFPPGKIVDILCQNGNLQEKMNDTDGAIKTYKYALMIHEANPKPLLCLGWLYFQLDRIEQSLIHMKKAESIVPEDPDILYLIARCHLKLKQHTTAYDCLRKSLTKDPSNSTYWGSLGILFAELMQLKQSYESLSKALKLDPNCPENFFNLGCLFELSSQPEDALSMYEKAIELQPAFQLALSRVRKITKMDGKNNSVEVQFKHPPFVFPLFKETKKEKPLFTFTQGALSSLSTRESLGLSNLDKLDNIREARKQQVQEPQNIQFQIKGLNSIGQSLELKPVRLDILAKKLEPSKGNIDLDTTPSKHQAGLPDMASLKLSRPLAAPEPTNGIKLPLNQSLNSSMAGLPVNPFSIFQNNYNNVNNFLINPVMNYAKELSLNTDESDHIPLIPSRSKTEEFPASSVKGVPNDLAKQLSGLQALIAKNNSILQNSIAQNISAANLKAMKNASSPIVLKHDPQVLALNENGKKGANQSDNKTQSNTEGKIARKLSKSDEDEEELPVQKKVKMQTTVGDSPLQSTVKNLMERRE